MYKFLLITLFCLTSGLYQARAQKDFLSDYANEQLKTIAPERQDSFFLVQGKYYYAFYTRESYRRAMECYLEALRLAIHHHHQDIVINCYFGIASVYDANNNMKQAIRYYQLYYDGILRERPFAPVRVARATYNIAATYAKARDTAQAYHYALKMSQMVDWIKEDTARAQYLLLIAQAFASIGKTSDFQEYFRKIPPGMVFTDGDLAFGRLYAESKSRYASLKGEQEEIITPLLEELAHTRDSIPLLNLLINAYAANGDYQQAFATQQLLIASDMRSMDRSTYGDINYRLLEADNLLKQRDNTELQLSRQQLKFRTSILYVLALLLALGLTAMWVLYRRNRLRSKFSESHNLALKAQDEANRQAIRQIHEGAYQQLQQLQRLASGPDPISGPGDGQLREQQTRIQALALAHKWTGQGATGQSGMQQYFEALLDSTCSLLEVPAAMFRYVVRMHGNTLCTEKLATLGLAINELLLSSIRDQALTGIPLSFDLECRYKDGEHHVILQEKSQPAAEDNTMTLSVVRTQLLQQLTRPLNAKIQFDAGDTIQTYLIIFSK